MLPALILASCTLSAPVRHVTVAAVESLCVTVEGSGPDVVLIPGLFGSSYGFRRIVPRLTEAGYRAIIVEPLGVGGSARPRRADYSLTAQAIRLAAALDSLGVRGAVVVAHAAGASIALRLAVRRPDLVAGIVSLEGGAAERAATPGFRRAMELAPWIRLFGGVGILRGRARRHLENASADPAWVDQAVVTGYTADYSADVGATLRAFQRMAAAQEPEQLAPQLREIRCPVRLLVGAVPHPSGVPAREVEVLRQNITDFAVDSVERSGHFLQEERPEAVVESVIRLSTAIARR